MIRCLVLLLATLLLTTAVPLKAEDDAVALPPPDIYAVTMSDYVEGAATPQAMSRLAVAYCKALENECEGLRHRVMTEFATLPTDLKKRIEQAHDIAVHCAGIRWDIAFEDHDDYGLISAGLRGKHMWRLIVAYHQMLHDKNSPRFDVETELASREIGGVAPAALTKSRS